MSGTLNYRNASRRKLDAPKDIKAPEMVERIARVLGEGTDDWRPWRHQAMRVLNAMLAPTPEMLKNASRADKVRARVYYHRMIVTAMGGDPNGSAA